MKILEKLAPPLSISCRRACLYSLCFEVIPSIGHHHSHRHRRRRRRRRHHHEGLYHDKIYIISHVLRVYIRLPGVLLGSLSTYIKTNKHKRQITTKSYRSIQYNNIYFST